MRSNTTTTKSEEPTVGEDKSTVHILYHGVTLCGFGSGEFPSQWPPGHKWDYMINKHNASCQKCKRLAEENEAKF